VKEDEMGGACSIMGEMRNAYKILVAKPEGKNHSEDLDVDGRVILKWIFGTYGLGVCTGFIWLRIGTGALVGLLMDGWLAGWLVNQYKGNEGSR
jgi:hypothetical protein